MKRLAVIILFTALILAIPPVFAEEYKTTGWDDFAKKVRFTVPQEAQLKNLLIKERDDIKKLREKTAEDIKKVLNPQQAQKWDGIYQKSGNTPEGLTKKRALLNPEYLKSVMPLSDDQRQKLYYIAWNYSRSVDKLRKNTRKEMEKILTKDQIDQWESALRYRLRKKE